MGTFIPHSVLGSSEDYVNTLQSTGMVRVEIRNFAIHPRFSCLNFHINHCLMVCLLLLVWLLFFSSSTPPTSTHNSLQHTIHSSLRLGQLQHSPGLRLWFCQEWRNLAPLWKRRATRQPLWWALRGVSISFYFQRIKSLLYGTVDLSPWERQLSAMTIKSQCSASLPVFWI